MTEVFSKYGTLIISILALIATATNIFFSYRFNRRNVLNNIHQLILKKSNDCNNLWQQGNEHATHPFRKDIVYNPFISEVIISLQLLDGCLDTYKQKKKRSFLKSQFWTQLNTSARQYIMIENSENYKGVFCKQLRDIQREFKYLFDTVYFSVK